MGERTVCAALPDEQVLSLFLGATDSFEVYCRERIVDNIIVTIASSATVDVSIDKI